MTEVRCLYGTVYREAVDAFEALRDLESKESTRVSIKKCPTCLHFHLKWDGGRARDVACTTKRTLWSKSSAKRKVKEMRKIGRQSIEEYKCPYSERDKPHYHLGHPPGHQTYRRPGRIYK